MLTKIEAEFRKMHISDVSYKISLNLNKGETFSGSTEITFSLTNPCELWLDYKGQEIHSLAINSQPSQIIYKSFRVYLQNLVSGQNIIQISFISEYSHDGLGLHSIHDPEDDEIYLYSQFEPFAANRVFPCFDQPDIKSYFTLTISSPSDWNVISNTSAQDIRKESNTQNTHFFHTTHVISTYLVAICAGPYAFKSIDYRIPLSFYCRKSMAKYLDADLYGLWTKRGFEFYEKFFNYPYPFTKYDQVFVPEFNFVAMENVGCVVYDDKFLFKDGKTQSKLLRACSIFMHEMSHMWFGNLVTMKWWDDLWLNESFATIISPLCMIKSSNEYLPNEPVQVFLKDLFPETSLYYYIKSRHGLELDQIKSTHPIYNSISHTIEIFSYFDAITYEKGSCVLKQLIYIVGEEKFSQALGVYFRTFAYKNAEFHNFFSIISQFSPDYDLATWADLWIKQAGVNNIYPFATRDHNGKILSLEIKQKPTLNEFPTIRPHCFDLGFYDDDLQLKSLEKVFIKDQSTMVSCQEGKFYILIDAGHNDFCKISLDSESLSFFLKDLSRIKSELHRLQIYGAIWDSFVDLKITNKEYLAFARANLMTEKQIFNLRFLSKTCMRCLFKYTMTEEMISEESHMIFEILLERVGCFDENSKQTVQKLTVGIMDKVEDIEKIVKMMVEGQEFSQAIRWEILKKYSIVSNDAQVLVQAEKMTDKSLQGHLEYLYCESAYPSLRIKEASWKKLIKDGPSMPKFYRIAMMKGFNQIKQKYLLTQYGLRYFFQILKISNDSDFEFCMDFVNYMFPGYMNTAEAIEYIEAMLEDLPIERNDVRRMLVDKLENLKNKIKRSL